MPAFQHDNRREHVRLPSDGSSAREISGEGAADLPEEARVADVSEGGVKLAFEWERDVPFPLENGDSISFRLTITGVPQAFEVMSLVRHVAWEGGKLCAGVQFCGLDSAIRESLKSTLMDLALTKLRSRSADSGPSPAPVTPVKAPGLATHVRKRSETSRQAPFESSPTAPPAPAAPTAPTASPAAAEPRREGHTRRRMYLGEILVKQGAIASEKLQQFLAREKGGKVPIGQKLVSEGLVDDVTIARALAEQARLPYVDLVAEKPDIRLAHEFPREVFIKHHCVPLRADGQALVVAMGGRPSLPALEEVELAVGRRVRVVVAAESGLTRWLKRIFNFEAPARFAKVRFPVQLRVEYRFLDKDKRTPVHDLVATGITRELGSHEMIIAGPLPAGVDADRVRDEALTLEVQVEGGGLANQMLLGCRPLSVSSSGYAGEYHIACYIDQFPEGGEGAWTKLCMALS